MLSNEKAVKEFFAYVLERQCIWYRKEVLKLAPPWTENEILHTGYFCNNYRELDAGTQVILNTVIKHSKLSVADKVFNIIIYRLFNTRNFFSEIVHGPLRAKKFSRPALESVLDAYVKNSDKPLFSSAYMTCGIPYVSRRSDVKHVQFTYSIEALSARINSFTKSLRCADTVPAVMHELRTVHYVGNFVAYQILLDLMYFQNVFEHGFFDWCFTDEHYVMVGPGALPSLKYIYGASINKEFYEKCLEDLRFQQYEYISNAAWIPIAFAANIYSSRLSLNNIQFALCEWRKYETEISICFDRIKNG
jgi:hypothetical protein